MHSGQEPYRKEGEIREQFIQKGKEDLSLGAMVYNP